MPSTPGPNPALPTTSAQAAAPAHSMSAHNMSAPSTTAPSTTAHGQAPHGAAAHSPRCIPSAQLFAGAQEVQISHQGMHYRLKKTALGKLILTK